MTSCLTDTRNYCIQRILQQKKIFKLFLVDFAKFSISPVVVFFKLIGFKK